MVILYTASIGLIYLVIGIITTPILWIWGMVDAYRTSLRLNSDKVAGKNQPVPSTFRVVLVASAIILAMILTGVLVVAVSEQGTVSALIYSFF